MNGKTCSKVARQIEFYVIYFINKSLYNNKWIKSWNWQMESSKAKVGYSVLLPDMKLNNYYYHFTCIFRLLHSCFSSNGWLMHYYPLGQFPNAVAAIAAAMTSEDFFRLLGQAKNWDTSSVWTPEEPLSKVLSAVISLKASGHQV